MDINRSNYEVFFLDYVEGNLSSAQEEILHRFLKFNPDLAAELELFKIEPLTPENEKFPNKNSLKKNFPEPGDEVNVENFDMYCIAYLEKDLTEGQVKSFEKYLLKNPELSTKLELYKKTYLHKEDVLFPKKNSLKHSKPILINWRLVMPVAAAAAILLMFLIGPGPDQNEEALQIAETGEQLGNDEAIVKLAEEKKPPVTKPPVTNLPSTLKVIRGSKSPVPVSDYKKENTQEKKEENTTENREQKGRMASLNLRNANLSELKTEYDEFAYFTVEPLPINPSSLSTIDMARYQFQKASKAIEMEEEDVFIWNLASIGLEELNKITGSNAELLASKDEEGSVSGIKFKSRFLNFVTPISRDE